MKAIAVLLVSAAVGLAGGLTTYWLEFAFVTEAHPTLVPAAQTDPTSSSGAPQSGPAVTVVNGETFDFGMLQEHVDSSHVFKLKNVGDAPLFVEEGDTTCQCTINEMKDGQVAPGETVDITLRWKVKESGPDPSFSQTARIKTNDPNRRILELVVRGYITKSIRTFPNELALGRISASSVTSARFRVFAYLNEKVEIKKLEMRGSESKSHFSAESRPLTKAEVAEAAHARSGAEVTVSIQPGLPLGPFEQLLEVTTDLEDEPKLEVPIRGNVVSDVSILGSRFDMENNLLNLGTVPQGEGLRHQLFILVRGSHRNSTEFSVKELDPPDSLRVTIGEGKPISDSVTRFPLIVEIPSETPEISRLAEFGKLRLATTHPQAKEIRVMIRFAVGK